MTICARETGARIEKWAPSILILSELVQSVCNTSLYTVTELPNQIATDSLCFSLQAFPDNAARREVEALAAVCPNEGCTWTGTIKEFEVHANAKHAGKLTPAPSQTSIFI